MRAPISASVSEMIWLDAGRATAWLRTLAVVSVLAAVAWIGLSRGGLDVTGKPLGTDFLSFWTASRLVLEGAPPAAVYDPMRLGPLQEAAFPGAELGYAPFPYPPIFLLICLPLGLLPYLASLAAGMAASGYAYWRVARSWLGQASGFALPALAFPAVLINLGHGQTGFLSGALFGAGGLLLQRRPFVAGLCFGALVFKPHLGLLIPVALVAARKWRAVGGAAVAALGLGAAATAAFGIEAWAGFAQQLGVMRQVMEQGLLHAGKVQSVFAALRLADAPLAVAYAGQALSALAAAVALGAFAFRRAGSEALGPVLIAATLLASPYLLDYDLILAAFPLAWLLTEGRRHGFLPWEKAAMLAAFVLPLVSRLLAMQAGLAVGPLVLAALLAAVLRRAWREPAVPA